MEPSVKKEPLDGANFAIYVCEHHTFGTDAVLLSHFAQAKRSDILCDLGTGCGIIPFLMLRDGNLKSAVGVDISREAIDLVVKSRDELNLERFSPICADIKEIGSKLPAGKFTLVTCNPPYKAQGAGIVNRDDIDRAARHETLCSLDDILCAASKLLTFGGRLCMCHRPERLAELMDKMRKNKIEPKKLRLVCQRAGEEPWLVLVEGRRGGNTGLRILPSLYVERNGELSEEMLDIYGCYKKER